MNPKFKAIRGMKMDEAIQYALHSSQKWHPVVSPIQFAAASREPFDPEAGLHGASMNVHTGEQLDVGTGEGSGYIVGGATDPTTGKRMKSVKAGSLKKGRGPTANIEPRIADIIKTRDEIAGKFKDNPEALIGSWVGSREQRNKTVALDASERIKDKPKAIEAMKARGEDEIIEIPTAETIKNPNPKKKK